MAIGRKKWGLLLILLAWAGSASASETKSYTYDARGRLVEVSISNGVVATYTYDRADNRTSVVVTGAATGGSGGGGASVPQTRYVVVPLNGYSLIVIP